MKTPTEGSKIAPPNRRSQFAFPNLIVFESINAKAPQVNT